MALSLSVGSGGVVAPPPGAGVPTERPVNPDCVLARPHSSLPMDPPGCRVVFSDDGSRKDPAPIWGKTDCADPERATERKGYRRLRVLDGDDVYGERCELGLNDHYEGPTALYREGERRATFASVRLPDSFPLAVFAWQNVLQMKQAQPADNGGGTPVLSLKAFDGQWSLFHSVEGASDVDTPLWSIPAEKGVWTRFAFDVVYSADPDRGSIKVYADLDGDGDFDGPDEESPTFITNTLKRETGGGIGDGYLEGAPLASHLRAGIYHDPEINCPAPGGCAVDIDDIEVLAP